MNKKTVLVVDDTPNIIELVTIVLEDSGYNVITAMDGETCLEKAHEKKPDCILLDIVMPGKKGLETLDELRKSENTKNIPVIIMTGKSTEDDIKEALSSGAAGYIKKPLVDTNIIPKKIKEALESKKPVYEDSKNILVVDDVPNILKYVKLALSQEGFHVTTAPDGDTALEIAAEDPPDLILLDIMMPGKNGFVTCEELKKSNITKDIPVIMLTAKSSTDDIKKALRYGAADYIRKPIVETKMLINKVKKVLNMV